MSTLFLRVEAIEARVASYSCPRGTSGRIHALRLRRRFLPTSRPQSTASGSFGDWNTSYDATTQEPTNVNLRQEQQQQQQPPPRTSEEQPLDVQNRSESDSGLRGAFSDTASTIADIKPFPDLRVRKKGRWHASSHLAEAKHGDTAGLRFAGRQFDLEPYDAHGDILRRAFQSESPHAIINALTRLIRIDENEVQGHETFRLLTPNTFSEILRCLDPAHFVGRYVDLHSINVRHRTGPYLALRPRREHGIHQFCVDFMVRISSIIEVRRSGGFKLSLSDYKYLLRCAEVVENPRASKDVWRAMEGDGVEPDTECYNHYLAGILRVRMSNRTQRSETRAKVLREVGPEKLSVTFRGYYERLDVSFKYDTTKIFNDMLQRGLIGDERTFCLLMISSARVGDVEGVKAMLDRVWRINVDQLMTMNENGIKGPKVYPLDSPFRPSKILLFALVHCFGINNMILTALRLVDYVSRNYSIAVPIEVWEDLLGLTYALSRSCIRIGKTEKVSPEAVSILWSALIAEPYNVKPNMAMYDRLIMNLLRRQRFGEARKRMEEARKVHIKSVYKYGKTVAAEDLESPLFGVKDNSKELELVQGTRAYQHFLSLQRDKTFQHLVQNHSRQYFYRWCRVFIKQATRSLLGNQNFVNVDLPQFIYDFRLFVPRHIEYPIGTGFISFASGSMLLSKALAVEKKVRPLPPHRTKPIQGAISSEQATVENDDNDDDNDYFTPNTDLSPGEIFGKS